MKNLIPEKLKKENGIYCIRNLITNENYIGKTDEGFQKRFNRHNTMLKNGKHFNNHLQRAYNLYGTDNFSFKIIYVLQPEDNLDLCEQGFIFTYRQMGECYNFLSGGEGMSKENNPFFGHHHTEELKQQISERMKNAEWNKGENNNFYGEDHSGENNGFFGRKHSEASRKSMSETKKRMAIENEEFHSQLVEKAKKATEASRAVRSKKVICVETGKIYNCISDAQKENGVHVGDCCRGTREKCNGYHWRYA